MRAFLLAYRYFVFGAFIVCNAIIASVGVWNLGLAQTVGRRLPIDIFLIFLGCFGLVFIFPMIFVEITRKNAVTSHVWCECLWTGLFWAMELAGAAALSQLGPGAMCNSQAVSSMGFNGACISTRVLLAFTWICAIILLLYFVFLITCAVVHQKDDPKVWNRTVRTFAWGEGRQCLRIRSPPPSPGLPRFGKKSPAIVAPQPRRVPAPVVYNAYRNGLGSEYEIEHYNAPSSSTERPVPPVPALHPPQRITHSTREAMLPSPVASLYPQHVQSALSPAPARALPPVQVQPLQPSPPPLGDWPRMDALEQPLRIQRKAPPASFTFPSMDPSTSAEVIPPSTSAVSPPARPRQPSGPRTRRSSSGEWHRPPPLDLSNISSFRG